jgi:hypothetical protein
MALERISLTFSNLWDFVAHTEKALQIFFKR